MSKFDASKFADGASYLVSDGAFKQYCHGAKSLGRSDKANGNLFCAPKNEIDCCLVTN